MAGCVNTGSFEGLDLISMSKLKRDFQLRAAHWVTVALDKMRQCSYRRRLAWRSSKSNPRAWIRIPIRNILRPVT